ncbi:MAG TPA: hypothetical protein VE263_11905 [Candidatus Angelobacter sp.]|nr:hypothetical protein [Candidatus Angelobacter sp.]
MLTIFSTAKPFRSHDAIIQRNALESWRRLDPDIDVILLGDDPGVAEVCLELNLRHEPLIARNELGAPLLNDLFERAQRLARHETVAYCNADIILTADFVSALKKARSEFDKFLMVGRRWDLDVSQPLDFSLPDWQETLVQRAHREGFQRLHYNIDYFAFPRGLYRNVPPLAIGRRWWDNWLLWKMRAEGVPVVDASQAVVAIHQNHDYSHHPQGMAGVLFSDESRRNFELCGGWRHLHTIEDANYLLSPGGIRPNPFYWLAPAKLRVRLARNALLTFLRTRLWHPLLATTRSLRHSVGLRKESLEPLRRRKAPRRHWLDQ